MKQREGATSVYILAIKGAKSDCEESMLSELLTEGRNTTIRYRLESQEENASVGSKGLLNFTTPKAM